jgi:hypothetical protein
MRNARNVTTFCVDNDTVVSNAETPISLLTNRVIDRLNRTIAKGHVEIVGMCGTEKNHRPIS